MLNCFPALAEVDMDDIPSSPQTFSLPAMGKVTQKAALRVERCTVDIIQTNKPFLN